MLTGSEWSAGPGQMQTLQERRQPDGCRYCAERYREATARYPDRSRHKPEVDQYDSLCKILNVRDHHGTTHAQWVDKSLEQLVFLIENEEAIPKRVQNLDAAIYERLVLAAYPNRWGAVVKLIRPLTWDCKRHDIILTSLSEKLDLCKFIESKYLEESAHYRSEIMSFLLKAGLSAVRANGEGMTPLQSAARCRDASCVQVLIESGADPRDFHFSDIDTPLHAALHVALPKDSDTKLLEFLIKLHEGEPEKYAYLSVNTRDDNGDTLLHVIAKVKSNSQVLRLAEYLRRHNVDRDIRNKDGKRAQDYVHMEDKRWRFLQGTAVTARTTDSTASTTRSPIPVPSAQSKENRRKELDNIIETFLTPRHDVKEFELSESESESENEDESGDEDKEAAYDIGELVDEDPEDNEGTEEELLVMEFDADVFDNLAWEVDCTADVWRTLLNKKLDKSVKLRIVNKIVRLARGEWTSALCKPLRTDSDVRLYEIKLSKGMRIIWEVAVTFSERRSLLKTVDDVENRERRIYAEIIRVWDVVTDHDNIHRRIRKIIRSNIRGHDSIIRKCLYSRHGKLPSDNREKRLPLLYMERAQKETGMDTLMWTPPASSKQNEYHIMKFYAVNESMVRYILNHEGTKVDFPFNVTEIEYTYIHLNQQPPCPLLILGRSGTGKTTCCLYRLWIKYLTYWQQTTLRGEPLLPRTRTIITEHDADDDQQDEENDNDDDEERAEEEEDFEDEYDHLHQVFVTKNRVLIREVRKNFMKLCKTNENANSFTANQTLPTNFQSVSQDAYPLFLTSRQLLVMLDASLPGKNFFARDEKGEMKYDVPGWGANEGHETEIIHDDSDDEEEETSRDTKTKATRKEMTYELFAHIVFPKLKKALKKKFKDEFHPSLVWMEIISFIKGSLVALKSKNGYLSLDEYKTLGRKQAPHFTADRDQVYRVFEAYRHKCRQEGYFDECDVVYHIYRRLLVNPHHRQWAIHQLFVDEVQDFTQAELALMIRIGQDPNDMFFTGDTAQSIMRGVSFRFSDLKTLFHTIRTAMSEDTNLGTTVGVPKQVYKLTQNYRSHAGVIRLANSVITLLERFFPHSFDHAEPDLALFEGPKPIVFDSVQFEDLALVLIGNKRQSSQIEFGAHQVIIVVNDEARENIPDELSHCLVLTIFESKGLEFDDVLLFNFFKDSDAKREWQVVTQCLTELRKQPTRHSDAAERGIVSVDLDILENAARSHSLEFDAEKHKILNSELKHLYTAITRARVNVWIYDEDTDARRPMFDYFQALQLVNCLAPKREGKLSEDVFMRRSSPQEWRHRGKEFYRRNLFKPAAKCFQRAGDHFLLQICRAEKALRSQYGDQEKKYGDQEKRDAFMKAALIYLRCEKPQVYLKAAACLRKAREYLMAARVYRHIGKFAEAGEMFRRGRELKESMRCYEEIGHYDKVVKILWEQKSYEEAILAWKMYEQKIKECRVSGDVMSLQNLEDHKPSEQFSLSTLQVRVAEEKLIKDDIKSARLVLCDAGWSNEHIVAWMEEKGKQKAAAKLLEEEGKLLEAATRYRAMDDLTSAISCLTRCKDLAAAKRQLADCYLTRCRLYYSTYAQNEPEETALAETSNRESMKLAVQFYEELNNYVRLGECMLVEGLTHGSLDSFDQANDYYRRSQLEVGQIHALYQKSMKRHLDVGSLLFVMRCLSRTFLSWMKKSGDEYRKIKQFYGMDDDKIDLYPLAQLLTRADINAHNFENIVEEDLKDKARRLIYLSVSHFRNDVTKWTPCPNKTGPCRETCRYNHGALNMRELVIAYKRLLLVHGYLLDNYNKDGCVRQLVDVMRKAHEADLTCGRGLVRLLMISRPDYAYSAGDVLKWSQLLWQRQDSDAMAMLSWHGRDGGKPENYFQELSVDTDRLLMIFYSALISGEYVHTNNLASISNLLDKILRPITKGKAACDYLLKEKFRHIFYYCGYSFYTHYNEHLPYNAEKSLNTFLEVIAQRARKCRSMCPRPETVMPIFEFQFVRGILMYLRSTRFTPAFVPESYLRLVNVFDALCAGDKFSTEHIVDKSVQEKKVTFQTNVRSLLRSLCEVFLGVTCKKFNMLKSASRCEDAEVVERVVVFTLVMLVNVGLSIDETIRFRDHRIGPQKTQAKRDLEVSLEEVIMRRMEILMKDQKSPHLSPFFQTIRQATGLREIAEFLKQFVDSRPGDRLLELNWPDKLRKKPATSHLEMDNIFVKFRPDTVSENYQLLQELDEGVWLQSVTQEETEDIPEMDQQPDDAIPDVMSSYEDDSAVDTVGCDICGEKFVVDDDADSTEARRKLCEQHKRSAEHMNARKLHKKFQDEVTPLAEELKKKITDVENLYKSVGAEEIRAYLDLKKNHAYFEADKKKLEKDHNWKAGGSLKSKANALLKDAESVEAEIKNLESKYETTPVVTENSEDEDEISVIQEPKRKQKKRRK